MRTGTPIALVDLKVVDERGAEVPSDDTTVGEIVVRAPWLTQGYYKDHANSERLWQGGWLHTQDIASRNAAGSLRITDRAKDILKIGGEWLSSLELDILSSHQAVADAAVIARPDDKWGEVPLGLVVLKPNHEVTEKQLLAHVRRFITAGVLPREAVLTVVRFVGGDRSHWGRQDQQGRAARKVPRLGAGERGRAAEPPAPAPVLRAPAAPGARARARRRAARRTGRHR